MMDNVILVGFGGHAKSVIDSIERHGQYHIVGYTDIRADKEEKEYAYLGNDSVLQGYYDRGVRNAFITLGYMGEGSQREILFRKLKEIGFHFPVIIDPTAVLARDAAVGEGTFIGKRCVVNSAAQIGKMCIINTGAVIEHESQIDDFSHISVNSTLCGRVSVGAHCFIGANTTIIQGLRIGSKSVIGAGSVVLRDVRPGETVYGTVKNPAED